MGGGHEHESGDDDQQALAANEGSGEEGEDGKPHKSQKLIYKIYIFSQFSKLELVQIYCFM